MFNNLELSPAPTQAVESAAAHNARLLMGKYPNILVGSFAQAVRVVADRWDPIEPETNRQASITDILNVLPVYAVPTFINAVLALKKYNDEGQTMPEATTQANWDQAVIKNKQLIDLLGNMDIYFRLGEEMLGKSGWLHAVLRTTTPDQAIQVDPASLMPSLSTTMAESEVVVYQSTNLHTPQALT